MPTTDRKPRARRRQDVEADNDNQVDILHAMHAAGRDAEAWAALRHRAIRLFAKSGKLTAEQAVAIFEAYRKRPALLPALPPLNQPAKGSDT